MLAKFQDIVQIFPNSILLYPCNDWNWKIYGPLILLDSDFDEVSWEVVWGFGNASGRFKYNEDKISFFYYFEFSQPSRTWISIVQEACKVGGELVIEVSLGDKEIYFIESIGPKSAPKGCDFFFREFLTMFFLHISRNIEILTWNQLCKCRPTKDHQTHNKHSTLLVQNYFLEYLQTILGRNLQKHFKCWHY